MNLGGTPHLALDRRERGGRAWVHALTEYIFRRVPPLSKLILDLSRAEPRT